MSNEIKTNSFKKTMQIIYLDTETYQEHAQLLHMDI